MKIITVVPKKKKKIIKKIKKIAKKLAVKKTGKKVAVKKAVRKVKTKKKIIKRKIKAKKVQIKKKVLKKVRSKKTTKRKVIKSKPAWGGGHKLERYAGNPVIHPARNTYWESRATFNPTAFEHDGKIHVLYRAVGLSDVSTVGYAKTDDGYSLTDRTFKPIFIHQSYPIEKTDPILYASGGGWNGGAEDPRITKIEDMLYMTYTAFDGWGSVRIGLTSISLEDFINKKWNWKKPVLISRPGEVQKNWVLFPEKIKGQYAILHSLSPEIEIEYVKDMSSFDGKTFISSIHQDHPKWQLREKGIRGVGGAPIKTKYGWLVFYHAMEPHEMHRYKLWAMILDERDPTKVLYRSKSPILEPDMFYENEGHKAGVIYSCGAVVKDGQLFVYYGGADMVSCVAVANLDLFLKELVTTGVTKLSKKTKK